MTKLNKVTMVTNSSDSIIVAGSGRSGTTWLGNIIAGDERRILFEPFECRRLKEFRELGLRPYFSPSAPLPQWHAIIGQVLSGAIEDPWVDQDRGRLDPNRDKGGIVIKEIRANAMLGWLSNNFPCKIVYLVRHPCAVIASRIKLGWETHIDAYSSQPQLMTDHLSPFAAVMAAAQTPVQRHAVMWCLENLVPLRQRSEFPWLFCYYEELFAQPEAETDRILGELALEFTPSRRRVLDELSRTCSVQQPDSAVDFLSDWKAVLSAGEREEVAGILEAFGIDLYDTDQVMPLNR